MNCSQVAQLTQQPIIIEARRRGNQEKEMVAIMEMM